MAKASKKDAKAKKTEGPELWVGSSKHAWPFSRGLLTRTLMHAGAGRKEAAAIARSVEQQLREDELSPIKPSDLHELLVKFAKKASGSSLSKRVAQQTPFFKDIQVETSGGKVPFSRAILARRLDDIGLDGKDAYATAREVDLGLRAEGYTSLTSQELREFVTEVLEKEYGVHFARTYQFALDNQGRIGVVGASDVESPPIPFSKGILMQSLLAAGAPPEAARMLARTVQHALRRSEDTVVTRAQIRSEVQRRLRDVAGRHVSARYMLLRSIRHLNRPLVVLIGGVSGTGKSHLASEVAYRLSVPRVVNTDSLREVMRAMISRELTPTLHTSTFLAWRSLVSPGTEEPERPMPELLYAGFREQVREVSVGVNAVLRRTTKENVDVVAEGVHLVPGFLDSGLREQAIVVPVMLATLDEEEHRNRFLRREQETGKMRPESHYLSNFAEIRALQQYLIELSERQGIPVLTHSAVDELADHTVDIVLSQVPEALQDLGDAFPHSDEDELDFLEYVSLMRDGKARTDDEDEEN